MDNPDGNTRPRREQHQPRHLDDYLVDLPQRRLPHDETHTAGQSATEYSRPREVTHTPPAGHTAADTSAAILLALQEIKRETREIREDSRQLQREVQFLMQQHRSTPPRSPAREVTTTVDPVTSTPHQRLAPQHSSPLIAELSERVRSMNLSKGQLSSPSSDVTPEYIMPYSPRHPSVALRQQPVFPSSADLSVRAPEQYVQPPPPRRIESLPHQESTYRGPKMKIPLFTEDDPRQFNRMKLALDNILPGDATERFKYQVLLDHLKMEDAALVADAYCHSSSPYSDTMAALTRIFGEPHKLALRQINLLLAEPPVKSGDQRGFRHFALKIQALVGMLDSMGTQEEMELRTGSHVSRLLPKLPHELRAAFRRYIDPVRVPVPTLREFADWLEREVGIQMDETSEPPKAAAAVSQPDWQRSARGRQNVATRSTTVLLVDPPAKPAKHPPKRASAPPQQPDQPKKFCPFCTSKEHYFNQCTAFKKLSLDQCVEWVKAGKRCWRCGRDHLAAQCYLKARCPKCNRLHLEILHEVNAHNKPETAAPSSASQPVNYYLDPSRGSCVLLKMVKVHLHYGAKRMETYAILDDGSERTMLLHQAAQQLGLRGQKEELALRTIRQDIKTVPGRSVSFSVSSVSQPQRRYKIQRAFTSPELGLSPHSHPVEVLRKTYRHLRDLPLHSFTLVQPLLLIGSDYPDLLVPIEPVHVGPPGGPMALKTLLGWTLQGPAKAVRHRSSMSTCMFISTPAPSAELIQNVSKLWQMDVLPYRNEKLVTRSKHDASAINLLEKKTIRVAIDGVQRYATPLLWKADSPQLNAPLEAVLGHLRGTEKRLSQDLSKAESYSREVKKLVDAGYVNRLTPDKLQSTEHAWFIPHHMVTHNNKDRVVFNCSFTYQGGNLNEQLHPGPTLGSSLLGVLLRFRQHPVAVSSDIKGMFHQVRLLPDDKPYLRFIWRDLDRSRAPTVYEWQVLPFGTTCSPCCATFALQKHVLDHSSPEEDTRHSVENCFYVDNLLQSFSSPSEAEQLIGKLQPLLLSGGFELRQWATNLPELLHHMPAEKRSESCELWLSHDAADPQERALGLLWHCLSDSLSYRLRSTEPAEPTMRTIYRVLARQYDPLGLLIPFTTRAKILVQRLWDKKRDWDDPQLPEDILRSWHAWEAELQNLPSISLPRCYFTLGTRVVAQTIHVFSDASEKAYGSAAYLRTVGESGDVQVAFLAARSRVAPVRQQSIPRLELCAAHTGAQLGSVLKKELSLDITGVVYWTDSSTVLDWLQSQSCRYKVFVGTRIADIQELTENSTWRYVNSSDNPADDITRGLTLSQLVPEHRWIRGPTFLWQDEASWPIRPEPPPRTTDDSAELRKSQFCGHITVTSDPALPDAGTFSLYSELLEATVRVCHGAATQRDFSADDYKRAEMALFRKVQKDSFPDDLSLLSAGKPVSKGSRLFMLSPEYDTEAQLIRVGGRLRRCDTIDEEMLHPILLDPQHPVTRLIIRDYDFRLAHPGPQRVFAELRRRFWILRGRAAVKKHQHSCPECQKWRGTPVVPKMADLPPSSVRLHKPAFYSTGMDCFGPYLIKIGRRTEKRWGIVFKCLTIHAVHLDLLTSVDTDAFLMALRRFIARRGKPHELLSDQGTNFRGGNSELQETFKGLSPELQSQLATQQIDFKFNPPHAPHFGGSWEREIRSIKSALHTILGAQTVTEEVLMTVLIEVEGIINSKPLGYTSSDIADPDPITPNMLLMGRRDPAMPQVVYADTDILSRRRWRHCQVLADQFWAKFIRDYLPTLQTRHKWQRDRADLTVDSIVMIIDPQLPRALWPVGKVTAVIPGADGRVRTVQVQVKDRTYTRPVSRLVRLPALPEGTSA
ncbi:uncharacterized protein ACNS7B_009326 isoform 1-T1 [Menidia menidia]